MSIARKIQQEHLKRLARLIERAGVAKLKRLYQDAQDDLERKIARRLGRGTGTFTAAQQQAYLAQLRAGQSLIMRQMAKASTEIGVATSERALRSLIRDFKRLERKFTGFVIQLPVEEAATFAGVIDAGKTSLLVQTETSMAAYGARLVKKMEQQLAVSLASGETTNQAIDRIAAVSDREWWQAERIVRTEQAWAANSVHARAIASSADEFPDMMMRWTELVSDTTRQPLDDRVGEDSKAMHGQVAPPGGVFTMPSGAKVPPSLVGRTWSHPPNRPNDRAVLQPWRPHWGIRGWVWRGGRRVNLARRTRKR